MTPFLGAFFPRFSIPFHWRFGARVYTLNPSTRGPTLGFFRKEITHHGKRKRFTPETVIFERRGGGAGTGVLGGRNAGCAAAKHQHELQTFRPEDYGYARAHGAWRAHDVPDHTHRHQPGYLRPGRGARRGQQDLCAVPEEP